MQTRVKTNLYPRLAALFLSLALASSCVTFNPAERAVANDGLRMAESQKPRYPIFLVHGIGWRSETKLNGLRYWDGVTPILDALGVQYCVSSQGAYGLIEDNAATLKEDLERWFAAHPEVEKVNIVAHSRGGLESRYLVSCMGMEDRVASLTLLSVPNRGSPVATRLLRSVKSQNNVVAMGVDAHGRMQGDLDPRSYLAARQLTEEYLAEFNERVPDSPRVYYQSFSGRISPKYPDIVLSMCCAEIEKTEGENDGYVSAKSAAWGTYRGLPLGETRPIVSHQRLAGQYGLDANGTYDASPFIVWLVSDLAKMGF
ncbi:MAG TPA: hypothetical protein PKO22_13230 [Treponemataceae bacterium]|nr:hypothetical protein [Treponemataceae bacterium]